MRLASRVMEIGESETLAITAKAKAMKAKGIDVIGFGAGEPDFDTPENIKEAAKRAIEEGFSKYTPVGGIDELKDAIIEKFDRDNGLHYDRSQIIVSCGGKHSFYNLAQVLFDQGDEVIVPSPYWVSYPPMILLAGARPVILPTEEHNGFKIQPEDLKKCITPKTKALVLNYPSNPTGSSYSREELEEIAKISLQHRFYIISDEIYEKIVYDGFQFTSIASIDKEVKDITLIINGVSKTYSMTGWRIGYLAGPREIVEAMVKVQGQSTSNPCSIAQKASVEALRGPQESVKAMVAEFQKRRNYMIRRLNSMKGISCFNPQGAFYAFPRFSNFYDKSFNGKKITNSAKFAEYLLEEEKVAVVAGSAFGADEFIRLSYATSMENIERGLDRIERAIEKLG